jgi:hypothetical protein
MISRTGLGASKLLGKVLTTEAEVIGSRFLPVAEIRITPKTAIDPRRPRFQSEKFEFITLFWMHQFGRDP